MREHATGRIETARAVLAAHRGADAREEAARAYVLGALDRLDRPFDQDAGPEHVTASAVVVGPRGTLLLVHKRLGIWLQPGGHLDTDETPWDAARREAYEETGLALSHPPGGPRLVHVDVHPAARGHVHLDLRYLLTAPDREPAPPPGESPDVRWFSWDDALAVADAALMGALRAARLLTDAALLDGAGTGPRREPAQWGDHRHHQEPMTTPHGAPEESTPPPADAARPLARLLDVQRHDTVIDQLRHRRATLPERASLADVDAQLGALDARVKELSVIRDEHGTRQASLEEQIEASRTRRATLEKRLFGGQVSAARDLQAMNEEVRHLARHISELEDREIEVMELLEPVDAELAAADERRTALDAEAVRLRSAIGAAEATLDTEIAAEAAARGTGAAAVEPELLAKYEALRAKLGGTGAAPLVGGSCGGCHLALPAMELDRIRRAPPDTVITCDQCGRILVP